MTRRTVAGLVLLAFCFVSCRKAGGVPQDPLDREAEEALVAYLKIDTTNPPGNETAGAVFLRDLLAKDGIPAQLIGSDPKRQALYAKLDSPSAEKALMLVSHIDVVPADASAWTQPPFGGVREGGYIWGRGALDIKSLTIAQAFAMIDLKRRGAKLRRDVVLLALPDEELGGIHGARAILEQHPELFPDVGFVLNEGGTTETVVDAVRFWGIEVQQKIPLWLRVTCEGGGGHGASPPDDGGATEKLIRVLAALDKIETPYRLDPTVARVLAAAAAVRKDPRGRDLRVIREPLNPALIEKRLPPGYRNLLRDTITITRLDAGSVVNVVPSKAVAEIDIRLLPDADVEAMLARIREVVGKNGTVEVLLQGERAPESPASGELFDTLSRALRESSPGSVVAPNVGAGTTDSRYFRAKGMTAYGLAPFKVNYYDADSVHGTDERIRAQFFHEGARLVRRIVRDFCAMP